MNHSKETIMKTKTTMKLIACWTTLLLAATVAMADDQAAPKKGSAELERMKTLVGTWKGKADMGQGPMDITIHYRVLAGGSVVEEKIFEGTPNEMVTMYYDQGGKLALTHYCMLGNRPAMTLKSADAKTIKFDFDKSCGIGEKESHMHAMTITFDDADTFTTSCKSIMDGKEVPDHATTLKRVKD